MRREGAVSNEDFAGYVRGFRTNANPYIPNTSNRNSYSKRLDTFDEPSEFVAAAPLPQLPSYVPPSPNDYAQLPGFSGLTENFAIPGFTPTNPGSFAVPGFTPSNPFLPLLGFRPPPAGLTGPQTLSSVTPLSPSAADIIGRDFDDTSRAMVDGTFRAPMEPGLGSGDSIFLALPFLMGLSPGALLGGAGAVLPRLAPAAIRAGGAAPSGAAATSAAPARPAAEPPGNTAPTLEDMLKLPRPQTNGLPQPLTGTDNEDRAPLPQWLTDALRWRDSLAAPPTSLAPPISTPPPIVGDGRGIGPWPSAVEPPSRAASFSGDASPQSAGEGDDRGDDSTPPSWMPSAELLETFRRKGWRWPDKLPPPNTRDGLLWYRFNPQPPSNGSGGSAEPASAAVGDGQGIGDGNGIGQGAFDPRNLAYGTGLGSAAPASQPSFDAGDKPKSILGWLTPDPRDGIALAPQQPPTIADSQGIPGWPHMTIPGLAYMLRQRFDLHR